MPVSTSQCDIYRDKINRIPIDSMSMNSVANNTSWHSTNDSQGALLDSRLCDRTNICQIIDRDIITGILPSINVTDSTKKDHVMWPL